MSKKRKIDRDLRVHVYLRKLDNFDHIPECQDIHVHDNTDTFLRTPLKRDLFWRVGKDIVPLEVINRLRRR